MLDDLLIKATEDSPEIHFKSREGLLHVSGRSLPEDAFSFYAPVHAWLQQYSEHKPEKTDCFINLEYFNTASAKQIFKLIQALSDLSKQTAVNISWGYDEGDKDMYASGMRFSKLCGVEINLRQN